MMVRHLSKTQFSCPTRAGTSTTGSGATTSWPHRPSAAPRPESRAPPLLPTAPLASIEPVSRDATHPRERGPPLRMGRGTHSVGRGEHLRPTSHVAAVGQGWPRRSRARCSASGYLWSSCSWRRQGAQCACNTRRGRISHQVAGRPAEASIAHSLSSLSRVASCVLWLTSPVPCSHRAHVAASHLSQRTGKMRFLTCQFIGAHHCPSGAP